MDCNNAVSGTKTFAKTTKADDSNIKKRCIFKNRQHTSITDEKPLNIKCLEANKTNATAVPTIPKNPTISKPILFLDNRNFEDEKLVKGAYLQRVNLEALAKLLFYIKRDIYRLEKDDMPAGEKMRFCVELTIMLQEVEKCISRSVRMKEMTYCMMFIKSYKLEAKYNQACNKYALAKKQYNDEQNDGSKNKSGTFFSLLRSLFSCCSDVREVKNRK